MIRFLRNWLRLHRVCAWCGSHLGGNPFARTTSHGICQHCKENMLEKLSLAHRCAAGIR